MKKLYLLLLLILPKLITAQPFEDEGMYFNGIDAYNLVPDTDYINSQNSNLLNRTIELAFKPEDVNKTSRQVIYEEGAQVNSILFYIENGYLILGAYRNNGDQADEAIFFRKPIVNDQWYHVALVLENGSNLSWYLGGVLQDIDNDAFSIPKHIGDINLGRSDGKLRYANCSVWTNSKCEDSTVAQNANNYYKGLIWGLRIWNSVRTEKEINDNKSVLIEDESNADLAAYLSSSQEGVVYRDNNSVFQTSTSTNTIAIDGGTVSVNDYNKNTSIYSSNKILYTNSDIDFENISMFNVLGQKVFNKNFSSQIDVSRLNRGIYFVILEDKSGRNVKKRIFIK